jgi:hypothetical protein
VAGVRRRALAVRGQRVRRAGEKGRTRPSEAGGGGRRCCADSGDERAFRLAMLGERDVEEAVLRDCEDIVQHGGRGAAVDGHDARAKNLPI